MKLQLLIILMYCFSITIQAQKVTVFDGETGKPIEGVTIFNKQQSISEVTTNDGNVNLDEFTNDEVLYFSHVSYAEFTSTKKHIIENDALVYLSKQSEKLNEIVVSVYRKAAKANRIAEQIELITTKDIEKVSPQTSADLLASVPGIRVQKSQFGGGSPVLRGMESNRVLLVVDGVRMNNAIYRKGHLQNSITVAPNLLDKAEIVFGPSSVIYGSDALGGVIHYYTKTPKLSEKKDVEGSLFSRFSSVNSEITNQVSLQLSFPKWASFTSVSYSEFGDLHMGKNRSHGFNDWGRVSYYSENKDGLYKGSPTINTNENIQRNTGYNQTDVLQKFYIPLSKKTDLKLNVQYSESSNIPRFDRLTELNDESDPSSLKFAEWYYGPQKRFLISPQLAINPKKTWLQEGTFTLAYQSIQESRIQRKFGDIKRTNKEEHVDVYSINGDFSLLAAKNRDLGYGFEVVYNDVASTSRGETLSVLWNAETNSYYTESYNDDYPVQSRYPDGGSSYLSSAVYVSYLQDISRNSTLNTGLRLTNTQLQAKWINTDFIILPDMDISLNNTALTATVGYVFKPNKTWQLNTVLSSAFRSPNIDDVGKIREKSGRLTIPNINLKPEYAYSAEFGLHKYINNRTFKIAANVYYTLLNNYIYRDVYANELVLNYDGEEFDSNDNVILTNINKGNAYVTGITTSYQGKLHEHWTTSGSLTYTKGKAYDTDDPMSSIPPLFGNFDLNYVADKFESGVNVSFNARKDISDYNLIEGIDNQNQTPVVDTDAENDIDKYYGTPAWTVVGMYGKYNVTKRIALQARLSNIFDEHYKEFASGISAPGRNFSLSLMAAF